jgi:histidinol-phosphate aminotransferase
MDLNENIVMPLSRMRAVIAKCVDKLDPRCYTSDASHEMHFLAKEIGKYCGCSSRSVGIGFGSDQILDGLFKLKLVAGKGKLVTVDPTYSMYLVLANHAGAKVMTAKLAPSTAREPFALDTLELSKLLKGGTNALVLASPNNPTGIQYPQEQLRSIIESFPDIPVIIDEAYVEYGEYSATELLSRFRNLIIVRSFSKAFGLANLRLGYFLSSDASLVERFRTDYQFPYPVAGFAVSMGIELLRRKSMILQYAEKTKMYREFLTSSLEGLGFFVVPKSNANFVLVKSPESKRIAEELITTYSIAVKYLPRIGGEDNFLRITVGSSEVNQKLLYALRRALHK